MATIAAIRTAIKDKLDEIADLNVYERMPVGMSYPAAVVLLRDPTRSITFNGGLKMTEFDIGAYMSGGQIEGAQQTLDTYLSGEGVPSIIAKLYSDRTLGGVVSQILTSEGWRGYGPVLVEGIEVFRAFLRLPVYHA